MGVGQGDFKMERNEKYRVEIKQAGCRATNERSSWYIMNAKSDVPYVSAVIRNYQRLNQNHCLLKLQGPCQSSLIKPLLHRPDEAEQFLSVTPFINTSLGCFLRVVF